MTYTKPELDVIFQAAQDRNKWLNENTRIRHGMSLDAHVERYNEFMLLRGVWHGFHGTHCMDDPKNQQDLAKALCESNEYVLDQLKLFQSTM